MTIPQLFADLDRINGASATITLADERPADTSNGVSDDAFAPLSMCDECIGSASEWDDTAGRYTRLCPFAFDYRPGENVWTCPEQRESREHADHIADLRVGG